MERNRKKEGGGGRGRQREVVTGKLGLLVN